VADYKVKDLGLADEGRLKVYWSRKHMPVLALIRKRFKAEAPLKGLRIGACLHVTKETAVLVETLMAGGAEVCLAPCNPLSTQDDVAAYLAETGVNVYAWRGMTREDYYWAIGKVAAARPHITMDDGGDLVSLLHAVYYGDDTFAARIAREKVGLDTAAFATGILGGTEETTTGVMRLRAMAREGRLLYPVIAVNDSKTKFMFDNRYGTGQSALDGIMRATNILIAGKKVVVAGYGWVGRGIASRARGLGAHVIVTEVDPIKALEAVYDGFEVMPMMEAARIGDIFITATGDKAVIRKEHFQAMKDGAILANAGHFNVEVSIDDLKELAVEVRKIREHVDEYILRDGRSLYLLGEGRLVNLVAAEGHPSEVMDMSFSNQALAVEYIKNNAGKLERAVYTLPGEIDVEIARLKLKSLGIRIDELTEEQRRYLSSWREGT